MNPEAVIRTMFGNQSMDRIRSGRRQPIRTLGDRVSQLRIGGIDDFGFRNHRDGNEELVSRDA